MTASVQAAAQDALAALLAADATVGVAPVWCDLAPLTDRPRMVYVSGDMQSNLARMTATPGAAPLSEDFDLYVRVWIDEAGDYRTLRNIAFTYADAATNVIRNNPTLSGSVFLATLTGREFKFGLDDAGQKWQMGVTLTVSCNAYNN